MDVKYCQFISNLLFSVLAEKIPGLVNYHLLQEADNRNQYNHHENNCSWMAHAFVSNKVIKKKIEMMLSESKKVDS